MAKEKVFENSVKKFLTDQGCWFIKYWAGAAFTKSGIPDILCCCKSVFFGIEVKADDGNPSDLQLVNLRNIDKAGGIAVLLYPKHFEKFKNLVYDPNNEVLYDELKQVWINEIRKRGIKNG